MADQTNEPESMEGPGTEPQKGVGPLAAYASSEGRVALAGLLIVAVWVVFDIILDSYGMDNTLAVLGAGAALVHRVDGETIGSISVPLIMKVLGYGIVIFGAIEIILDLRFGGYDSVGKVVGALLAYVAFVLAFVGARAIKLKA